MAALSLLRDAVVRAAQLYERLGPDRTEDSTTFAARCEELGLVAPGWADRVAAVST